jgi:glycosyltransferase involved in cell wall biosynthesis
VEALKNNGVKAIMLVRDKQTDEISVVGLRKSWKHLWHFLWERVVIWKANCFHRHRLFEVDIANTGCDITHLPEFRQADVIHLHWINQGMLSLKTIRRILLSGKPVVWTMHDLWPCTGICHYPGICDHYRTECHHCPFLYKGGSKRDLSYRTFRKKQALYTIAPIRFVACSHWLKEQAQTSALFVGKNVVNIPNAINTSLYKPGTKQIAREKARLPQGKKLVLFGSLKITDERKGFTYLAEACRLLAEKHPEWRETLGVVVFGKHSEQIAEQLPFHIYALPYITHEHTLVDVYNAVDLFAIPSLEENLPNMIMEAMACGVPCVGFNTGGIPEMIDHLHNGYVAQYRSAEDFANGLHWVLADPDYAELAEQARRKVLANYSESAVAKRYTEVYNQITGKHA